MEYKEKILPIEYHIESIEFDIGFLSPELEVCICLIDAKNNPMSRKWLQVNYMKHSTKDELFPTEKIEDDRFTIEKLDLNGNVIQIRDIERDEIIKSNVTLKEELSRFRKEEEEMEKRISEGEDVTDEELDELKRKLLETKEKIEKKLFN